VSGMDGAFMPTPRMITDAPSFDTVPPGIVTDTTGSGSTPEPASPVAINTL